MSAWNPIANEIFARAAEIPDEAARHAFVAERCGDDGALRAQVEALLQVTPPQDDFLSRPFECEDLTLDSAAHVAPGTLVGPYKLLEKIGEGGFGVVFMAEQKQPIRRKVALKVIKAGMDTKEVIARFEAERQALAMMAHPNIAKVLDAGTTSASRPYFVMELVRGIPITQFCDESQLDTNARLDLFISVCLAIQHAHQRAIIHRDIKPSNVLVTMHDDTPVPKVIDFGIAKCTQTELTQKTIFTQFRQLMGTPAYMAPEQAQMSGLDIDTRCDVYALGVLLYELLTGVTPFDAKELLQGGLDEICRRLREEEPPKPSRRVSTLDAPSRSSLATTRSITADKLGVLLRGELDWIVMKAMEKNRTKRYETASGLAEDVRRFLSCEPVSAVAPSLSYRTAKFAKRHKTAVGMSAALLAVLLFGAAAASWQAYHAILARDRAEKAETQARQQAGLASQNEQRAIKSEAEMRRLLYISDINAVRLSWQENDAIRVQELLKRHIPSADETDHRGFEWYYYWQLVAPRRAARVIDDFQAAPRTVSFSADGRTLVVADRSGRISFFDHLGRSQQRNALTARADWQNFAMLSPTKNELVMPKNDPEKGQYQLTKRSLVNDQELAMEHADAVQRAAFSMDGRLLATTTIQGFVTVWDAQGLPLFRKSTGTQDPMPGITFSNSGDLLAAGVRGQLFIWTVPGGEEVAKLELDRGRIRAVAFSPLDEQVFVGDTRGNLTSVDLETWARHSAPLPHSDSLRSIALSPSGDVIATGSRDNTIKLRDTKSLQLLQTLKGHGGIVDWIAFSRDGKSLASASQDNTVLLWDMTAPKPRTLIHRATGADSDHFVAVGASLSTVPKEEIPADVTPVLRPDDVTADKRLAYSPTGLVAMTTEDHEVEIYRGKHLVRTLKPPRGEHVRVARFSGAGRYLAAGLVGGKLCIWDLPNQSGPTPNFTLAAHDATVRELAFSPDETLLASGSDDGTLATWQLESGKPHRLRWPAHDEGVWAITFHPIRKGVLLSGGLDRTIKVWEAQRTTPVTVLRRHTASVNHLLFSPDARTLFSAGGHGVIRIWDTEHWDEKCVFVADSQFVTDLDWLGDGTLISSGTDGVRFWRAPRSDALPQPTRDQ